MQQIQLSIPEPCHQSWEGMTPTEQGRFCKACAKSVIDFSTMSDTQVLNYFYNVKNDNVCGRVYPDQLDRTIAMPVPAKKKLFGYWNYITMLFLFFSKTNQAKAQGGVQVITNAKLAERATPDINAALSGRVGGLVINNNNNNNNVISGNIKDREGNPISFASLKIKGVVSGISAGTSGRYSIITNVKTDELEISAIGFITKNVSLKNLHTYDFVLEKDVRGDVVLIGGISSHDDITPLGDAKHVAIIKVKDNATMQPIEKVTLTIAKIGNDKTDLVLTDKKGLVKIRKIKEDETYIIKITAEGYLNQELQISATDLDERKINKEIFLEKAPVQSDYKQMDSVAVRSYGTIGKICRAGGISVTRIDKTTYRDSVLLISNYITGALKIVPNPIQKGNSFKVELKVKQTGLYQLQLIDAGGQVVMQKQITVTTKQYMQQLQSELKWSSGTYFLRVLNDKNILISTGKMIIR